MGLIQRFDPPAFLPDFNLVPGLLEEWHQAVSSWFEVAIASERKTLRASAKNTSVVQFYNPACYQPAGPLVEQPITWNAFPKELLRQFGRERALEEADKLFPLSCYPGFEKDAVLDRTYYRPGTEYCEWHAVRDAHTNKIRRLTFTSEPPEYWQALFGESLEDNAGDRFSFHGSRELVLKLYREFVSPEVQMEDLIATEDIVPEGSVTQPVGKGAYNPYNKWNTTHGIVHLNAPPNSLQAEINLGADATVLREDGHGRLLVEPEALICGAAYGGPDRNSDPTIGATVNALARAGAMVTLKNPVGLYMDHIDLAGWSAPDGQPVTDCVKIVRGSPGMIERLEIEVPAARTFTVSDLKIGGVPIEYGGQVAECITVKLVGVAGGLGSVPSQPLPCVARCCIDPANPRRLNRPVAINHPPPVGTRPALFGEGEAESRPAPGAAREMMWRRSVRRRTR